MIFYLKTVRRDNHRENIKVLKVLIRLWHYLYEKIWFGRRYALRKQKRMNNIIEPAAEHSKWKSASSDLSVSINKNAHYAGLESPEMR